MTAFIDIQRGLRAFARTAACVAAAGLAVAVATAQDAQPTQPAPPQAEPGGSQRPLYIDDQHEPMIMIAWEQRDGTRIELSRQIPWGTKNDRIELGENVLAFAAVGGTRIELQAGHPLGSVVRVGFYKNENEAPFFADIRPGSTVEIRLEGVRFIEPARATQGTALHHLQYSMEDVLNCGLDASAIDQYNTARPDDTLNGQISRENGRPGVLRVVRGELPDDAPRYYRTGEAAGDDDPQPAERFATIRFQRDEETGAIGIRADLPYELFRHVRDPWLRAEPGTFFEPTHFHLEFESLPNRAFPGGQPPPEEGAEARDAGAQITGP